MRRRWTLLVAGLGVTAVLLSGCSSKQEASDTLPGADETSSSSPELDPLGPPDFPVPDKARTQDAAGAEAALRYYLALIHHLGTTTGQPLRDLSRDCRFCNFLADRIDADAAAGFTYMGGEIKVEGMSPPAVHETLAEFAFSAGQGQVTVVDTDGQPVPGRGEVALTGLSGAAAMSWSSRRQAWLVTQLSFRQP